MSLISKEHLNMLIKTFKKLLDTKVDKKDIQNYITLTDDINGLKYIVGMRDGNLVSASRIMSIKITEPPFKTQYYIGEMFDPTGMVISAVREDGSVDTIDGYTLSNIGAVSISNNTIDVSYTEFGIKYEFKNIELTDDYITPVLDFDYNVASDGSYILTSWNQTLNGVSSTECIIPDDPMIML